MVTSRYMCALCPTLPEMSTEQSKSADNTRARGAETMTTSLLRYRPNTARHIMQGREGQSAHNTAMRTLRPM